MNWKSWKYKNLTLLFLSFALSFFLGSFKPFHDFIFDAGRETAIFAGIIFISTFTAPLAAVTLLVLAEKFPLIQLWGLASFAAIISDFLFFNLVRDGIAKEIQPIYEEVAEGHMQHVVNTKHFRWMFPAIGALIILSPLPSSTGLHLMGIPKLKRRQFIALSAAVNVVGIAFIILLSFIIKP
ncbi:MAG TPA: hypothetical protein VG965_07185 [Patescibacteria group bacterium]|nr:hypothetical protein [Patescibacteria group bacterium]